jgi:hypothetical protein
MISTHLRRGVNECLAELSDTPTLERLNWRGGQGEKSTGLGMGIAEVSSSYWPGDEDIPDRP